MSSAKRLRCGVAEAVPFQFGLFVCQLAQALHCQILLLLFDPARIFAGGRTAPVFLLTALRYPKATTSWRMATNGSDPG